MEISADMSAILFVDDEANILSSLRRELHDWAKSRSLEILTAPSAREGLKILEARDGRIPILVSDLKMPEMKGSDFLVIVKEKWPDIITLLLSGYSETQDVMKAVNAGIFGYILKPWDPDYLRTELEKALKVHALHAENVAYMKTMEEELKWAGEMQRAMLRPSLTSSQGVEFRTSYRPVSGLYCGGDYYDVLNVGPDRYLVLIGDVAGHGVRAAFITGILKAVIFPEYIGNWIGKRISPAAFLTWLNERMNFELRQNSNIIITFFAGILDVRDMTLSYANAGQNHPFIIRGGTPIELPVSGSGLGYASTVVYAEKTEKLVPGDVLIVFTDGLVEADASNGHVTDLRPILAELPYGNEYHKRIIETALVSSGASAFRDDVTIVTAKVG